MDSRKRTRRSGFTLVEMLTVIVIISILAGLIIPAVGAAQAYFRRAAINHEVKQMQFALTDYKTKFGEFPPDGTEGQAAIERHIKKRWPKCTTASVVPDTSGATSFFEVNGTLLTPENALTFWLAGPSGDGFSANPSDPFASGGSREGKLFEFETDKPRRWTGAPGDVAGGSIYLTSAPVATPYIYFRSVLDTASGSPTAGKRIYDPSVQNFPPTGSDGVAVPYKRTASDWYATDTFQIISAGLDGDFGEDTGVVRVVADGTTITDGDYDNQGSFVDLTLDGEM